MNTILNRKVAFLDRDGVVNVDSGYIYRPDQLEWIEGVPESIRLLNERDFDVVIVTNQSGIARGYYSEDQFLEFADWIQEELKRKGAIIRRTLYCPHHPTEGQGQYRIECSCRKPNPGMIEQVFAEEGYARESSFLIGDKESDVEAAQAAGIRGYLFRGGSLLDFTRVILEAER